MLTSADDTSATTGHATAAPPPGVTFASYTFTATPLNGAGPPVTVTSATPAVDFTGLLPETQYVVTVAGTLANGTSIPAPNTLAFVTPSDGCGALCGWWGVGRATPE